MTKEKISTTGIIIRDAHIQIDLRKYGFGRERLNLLPTQANMAFAARLRKQIISEIEIGSFVLAKHFPDSPRVSADIASITFKQLASEWLETRRNAIEHSTLHHYQQTIGSYHFEDWSSLHVKELDFRKLKAKLAKLPAHPKTYNNIASVLHLILEYGHKSKILAEPLHAEIDFRTPPEPEPDPLDRDEIDKVLQQIPSEAGRNYYEFAFFTGLRPSEMIALKWANVDIDRGLVEVTAAITRGQEKGPKNKKRRTVEVSGLALRALVRQRELNPSADGYVFIGLNGKSYTTADGPLDAFWKPALKAAGIRYRDARQTRHTFASLCLQAGSMPGWVAAQMGHTTEMFFRVYAKWLNGNNEVERNKLDKFLERRD